MPSHGLYPLVGGPDHALGGSFALSHRIFPSVPGTAITFGLLGSGGLSGSKVKSACIAFPSVVEIQLSSP